MTRENLQLYLGIFLNIILFHYYTVCFITLRSHKLGKFIKFTNQADTNEHLDPFDFTGKTINRSLSTKFLFTKLNGSNQHEKVTVNNDSPSLENVILLAKEIGIFHQSSLVYNGWPGHYDYGPLGIEIKNNLRNLWWSCMVHQKENVYGCETAIITHPQTLRSSGHVEKFTDSYLRCKSDERLIRLDALNFTKVFDQNSQFLGYIVSCEDDERCIPIQTQLDNIKAKTNVDIDKLQFSRSQKVSEFPMDNLGFLPCPLTGLLDNLELSSPRSLLFKLSPSETPLSRRKNSQSTPFDTYLRPETSQVKTNSYHTLD